MTFSVYIAAVVFRCEGIKGSLRDILANLISVNQGEKFLRCGSLQYELWDDIYTLLRSLQRAFLNQLTVKMRPVKVRIHL